MNLKLDKIENNQKKKKLTANSETKITFLGGLREIKRNCMLISHENEYIMIDCGVGFVREYGINFILPDLHHIHEYDSKFKALILTHGHQDHIGGIWFLLKQLSHTIKIYGGKFTLALVEEKCSSIYFKKFKKKITEDMIEIESGKEFGVHDSVYFKITPYHITHSIPDSYGFYIKTPSSSIFHTGDFKFDLSPLSRKTDFSNLLRNGTLKPDVLLIDSTNADHEGFSTTEYKISQHFLKIFRENYNKDIVIPIFSSTVNRIIQIIKIAKLCKRKVVLLGTTLNRNLDILLKIKHDIQIDKNTILNSKYINSQKTGSLVILCTGTQGEENSALYRIIKNEYKLFDYERLKKTVVLFSSRVIPGNELSVIKSINLLAEKNIDVLDNRHAHASGHAYQDDIRWMLNFLEPKNVIPIHGTFIKLLANTKLSREFGLSKSNVFLGKNGAVFGIKNEKCRLIEYLQYRDIFTDQNFNLISTKIIQQRERMSKNGVFLIWISKHDNEYQITHVRTIGFYLEHIEKKIKKILSEMRVKILNNDQNTTIKLLKDNIKQIFNTFFKYKNKLPLISVCFINKIYK